MSGTLPVEPRFSEKPVVTDHTERLNSSETNTVTSSMAEGILTTVYDNKVIVICIVVTVVVICILAYFVFKNPEPIQQSQSVRKTPTVVSGAGTESSIPDTNTNSASDTGTETLANKSVNTPAKKKDKAELQKLLAVAKAPTPQINNFKSDNEIAQLMEDESDLQSNENNDHVVSVSGPDTDDNMIDTVTSDSNVVQLSEPADNIDNDSSIFELVSDNNPEDNNLASDDTVSLLDDSQVWTLDNNQCSQILSNGNRCRNSARIGDKCTRHSK